MVFYRAIQILPPAIFFSLRPEVGKTTAEGVPWRKSLSGDQG
jgi:hypothetical protein